MVRMSDILKKAREKERKARQQRQERPLSEPTEQKLPRQPEKEAGTAETKAKGVRQPQAEKQRQEQEEISELRISPLVMKTAKVATNEASLQLYEQASFLMKEILKKDIDYESIDAKRIAAQIEKIVDQLSLGNEEMLRLAFIKESAGQDYLFFHLVNVCIFSIEVGLGMSYERSKLIELGISALLHDFGMIEYLYLITQPRKLTDEEFNQIKTHPIRGSEILEKIKNLDKIALYVAHQEHERVDGSGYPRGLKKESIEEYARIVGIVDVFEALLHLRSYREEFLPSEALREILTNKSAFDYGLIKILIERIGIFPIGSIVELSTKEVAVVVKLNHIVPLRPVAKIINEANGKEPKQTKIIDLSSHPTIYIKKGLRKSELKTPPH